MGHNGGFNPYRDRNGEFTTPEGSGKPGRSRKGDTGGAAAGRTSLALRANSPARALKGVGASGLSWRTNLSQRNIALGGQTGKLSPFFTRAEQYRSKGGDIFGNNPNGPVKLPKSWR